MGQIETPLFTVIIPVRNGAKTIETQLFALAAQNAAFPFEVIVADNGSSDETRNIVTAFSNVAPIPVRLIDASSKAGVSAARNAGVASSKASFIAFCDADDRVADGWLAALATTLEQAELAGGTDIFWSQNERERHLDWSWNTAAQPHLGLLPFARGGNLAIRRSVYERLGGFSERWPRTQDVEFSWRAQIAGFRLAPSIDAQVRYRVRPTKLARISQAFRWSRNEVGIICELDLHRQQLRLREHTAPFLPPWRGMPRSVVPIMVAKRLGHICGCLQQRAAIW